MKTRTDTNIASSNSRLNPQDDPQTPVRYLLENTHCCQKYSLLQPALEGRAHLLVSVGG